MNENWACSIMMREEASIVAALRVEMPNATFLELYEARMAQLPHYTWHHDGTFEGPHPRRGAPLRLVVNNGDSATVSA